MHLVENRSKKNVNEPDFHLYENITKGDKEKFNGKTFKPRTIDCNLEKNIKKWTNNFLAGVLILQWFMNWKI